MTKIKRKHGFGDNEVWEEIKKHSKEFEKVKKRLAKSNYKFKPDELVFASAD